MFWYLTFYYIIFFIWKIYSLVFFPLPNVYKTIIRNYDLYCDIYNIYNFEVIQTLYIRFSKEFIKILIESFSILYETLVLKLESIDTLVPSSVIHEYYTTLTVTCAYIDYPLLNPYLKFLIPFTNILSILEIFFSYLMVVIFYPVVYMIHYIPFFFIKTWIDLIFLLNTIIFSLFFGFKENLIVLTINIYIYLLIVVTILILLISIFYFYLGKIAQYKLYNLIFFFYS